MRLVLSSALPQSRITDITAVTASADTTDDGIVYSIHGDSAWVTGYTGSKTEVTIPGTLGGKPVTIIADAAFKDKKITKVDLPSSLTGIGYNAFNGCSKLEYVKGLVFSNVTSIGNYAFHGCSSLVNISFPKTLKEMGANAFEDCTSMVSAYYLSTTTVGSLYGTFKNCKKLTSDYLTFPTTLKSISGSAFYNCDALTSVDLSDCTNLTLLDQSAFEDCSALTTVRLPSSITKIGSSVFKKCNKLTTLNFPSSLTEIGIAAFYGAYRLNISEDCLKNTKLKTIGAEAFANRADDDASYYASIKSIFIPSSVTSIGKHAFGYLYHKVTTNGGFTEKWKWTPCAIPTKTIIVTYENGGAAIEYASSNTDAVQLQKLTHSHNYTGVVTTKATCIANGVMTYTCSLCGDSYTEKINKTGHKFEEKVGYVRSVKDPTPASTGIKQYTCVNCLGLLDGGTEQVQTNKINYRISGKNRYETAQLISDTYRQTTGKITDKFTNLIIASGDDFADALSASYLSTVLNAQILLVNKSHETSVYSYIEKNASSGANIYIMGGENAVSADFYNKLKKTYKNTQRVYGKNRYGTNKAVFDLLTKLGKSMPSTAIVATGNDYADALSASASGAPIILVNGKSKKLSDVSASVADLFKNKQFVIAGGVGAVSNEIQLELSNIGSVARLSGKNRYETSVKIATKFFANPAAVTLAFGGNYPDGLCGGLLSNKTKCPMILTREGNNDFAKTYAKSKGVKTAWILGGTGAVSDNTVNQILK